MADSEKIGRPWDDGELDAIVADYFAMLTSELAGEVYVKSHHSAALMAALGRTHRSVEFKHQNISAVAEEMGLPWIHGYKPKRNYQNAIFEAIERHLIRHPEIIAELSRADRSADAKIADPFVALPTLEPPEDRPPKLKQLVRKFDPVERDFRNRKLGKAGEAFVVQVERQRLVQCGREDLSHKVRWVADLDGDGAGYDVLSFDRDGRERLLEVKTTNGGPRTPFFLTRNEHETAAARSDVWRLYRVHLFAQQPSIFMITPPLARALHLRAEAWRASFT